MASICLGLNVLNNGMRCMSLYILIKDVIKLGLKLLCVDKKNGSWCVEHHAVMINVSGFMLKLYFLTFKYQNIYIIKRIFTTLFLLPTYDISICMESH